jgi:hypothetical protein
MKASSTISMKTTSFYSLSTSRISVREDQERPEPQTFAGVEREREREREGEGKSTELILIG